MDIGNIITGHVNELLGLNKDISKVRLDICYKCPIYSPRFGGICNNKLYLNKENGDVSLSYKLGYIKGCGCRILAKTTIKDERCPVGKW